MEVWIPAGKFQNRALHGDLVAVCLPFWRCSFPIAYVYVIIEISCLLQFRIVSHDEVYDFGCEKHKLFLTEDSPEVSVDEEILENEEVGGLEELMNEHEENTVQKVAKLTGEIVGILQRIQRDYVACLEEIEDTSFSGSVR